MATRKPRPLFSAFAPEVETHPETDVLEESDHPANLTGRVRRWLTTDPEPLFRAQARQEEFQRRLDEADVQPRS